MGLTQTVAPTEEPISIAEAQEFSRIDSQDETATLKTLIASARMDAETITGMQFVTATWAYKIDEFPGSGIIVLPRPKLIAVSSITYTDTNGTSTTLAATEYTVVIDGVFGEIHEAYGVSWPNTRDIPNAVVITYTAGFGAASAVPSSIKSALMIHVDDLFNKRGEAGKLSDTVHRLLAGAGGTP